MGSIAFPSEIFEEDFKHVYEPTDDTFLLIDAIKQDQNLIENQINPVICLELGCGSGAVITSVAKLLGPNRLYFGTDINYRALLTTKKCCAINGVNGKVNLVKTDLVKALEHRISNKVDLLIFNPPFMISEDRTVGKGGVEVAWHGGSNGRKIIDRFLPLIPTLLSPSGVLYLIVNEHNDTKEIGQQLERMDFNVVRVKEGSSTVFRCAGDLVVLRCTKLNLNLK